MRISPPTYPPVYKLKYTVVCADVDVQGIRFVSGNKLILGVAVRKGWDNCLWDNPQPETLRVTGKMDDPKNIRTLSIRPY